MNKKIDLSKYEGHTTTHWSARNQGDGSLDSCDDDYEHDEPFLETDGGNIGIGYMDGGRDTHSIEEKRANMRLMADAPLLLAEVNRLRKTIEDIEDTAQDYDHPEVGEIISMCLWVMEPDSAGYNSKIPWKNVHSGDD